MESSQSEPPMTSIIIPVYNGRDVLDYCLDSLQDQTYPRDHYEIIVVDNASDVPLHDIVDKYDGPIRLLREGKRGSYAARNKGLTHAHGRIMGFTDADCIPARDWIENGVKRLVGTDADLVGGHVQVFPRDPERPSGFEVVDLLTAFPQRVYVETRNFAVTANMFMTREVMNAVGPFDDVLKSGGDMDFGQRAVAAGFDLAYEPDALVRHPARSSFSEHQAKTARVTRGKLALGKIKPRRPWLTGIRQWVPPLLHSVRSVRRLPWLPRWSRATGVFSLMLAHYLREHEEWKARRLMGSSEDNRPKAESN